MTTLPNSPFVAQREKEEHETEVQIRKTINNLVAWANKLNAESRNGCDSKDTITYKFRVSCRGFEKYSDYFEKLWQEFSKNVFTK